MAHKTKWQVDFNSLYALYKHIAKKRGYDWQLSKTDFAKITQARCYLCGRGPHRIHKHSGKNSTTGGIKYNGVDRLDNAKGYTLENAKPCCFDCNRMKSDRDLDEFKKHILKITKVIL